MPKDSFYEEYVLIAAVNQALAKATRDALSASRLATPELYSSLISAVEPALVDKMRRMSESQARSIITKEMAHVQERIGPRMQEALDAERSKELLEDLVNLFEGKAESLNAIAGALEHEKPSLLSGLITKLKRKLSGDAMGLTLDDQETIVDIAEKRDTAKDVLDKSA